MAVLGMAVFMSGVLLRFRPLLAGAAVMWGGTLLCLWLPVTLHALVMVGGVVLGYLVPDYGLSRQQLLKAREGLSERSYLVPDYGLSRQHARHV